MKEKLDQIEKEIKEKMEESIYNDDIYITVTIVFEVLHSILDDQAVAALRFRLLRSKFLLTY